MHAQTDLPEEPKAERALGWLVRWPLALGAGYIVLWKVEELLHRTGYFIDVRACNTAALCAYATVVIVVQLMTPRGKHLDRLPLHGLVAFLLMPGLVLAAAARTDFDGWMFVLVLKYIDALTGGGRSH